MPLVKDTSYREIPYSPETPSDEFHALLTVSQVVQQIWKHQNHVYRCRSVGTVTCEYTCLTLHELNDDSAKVRLSLAHMKPEPPSLPCVFHHSTVQIFGFVHWINGVGPVMFAQTMMCVTPNVAEALLRTMRWVTEAHYSHPDVNTSQKRKWLRARRRALRRAQEEAMAQSSWMV